MTDVESLNAESPCTKVCVINAESQCIGCYRTLDEIGRWSVMSTPERIETNRRCLDRRNRAGESDAAEDSDAMSSDIGHEKRDAPKASPDG